MWEIKPRLVQLPGVVLEPCLEFQGLNHPSPDRRKASEDKTADETHMAEYRHTTGLGVQVEEKV